MPPPIRIRLQTSSYNQVKEKTNLTGLYEFRPWLRPAAIVFRAPALHARGAKVKARRQKRKPDNQIVVVDCSSVEPFLSSLCFLPFGVY